jgi:lipopolysaccharide transport system permease protein
MLNYLKELYKYRELLVQMALREIKARYKQTVLGIGWAILRPVITMVVFTVIFSGWIKLPSEGVPYPIFSYSALLFWTFFATSVQFGADSVINQANLVNKIYFPREVLPISSVMAAFVDFLVAAIVFVGMMFYYKVLPNKYALYLFLLVPIQLILTFGVIFFLSAVNVHFRDIRHGVPFLVQIWMYASPIVYSLSSVPEYLRNIYVLANPMAALIDSYRRVILHGLPPEGKYLIFATATSMVLLVFAYLFFKKMERSFADVI